MTKRYALRDDQWEQIKDLLPGRIGAVGVTAKDNRLFVLEHWYPHNHSLYLFNLSDVRISPVELRKNEKDFKSRYGSNSCLC